MSFDRARAFQAAGLLVLAAALVVNSDVRPAPNCPYSTVLPNVCLDYSRPWAAPSYIAGVLVAAAGLGLLWAAMGTMRTATLARAFVLVAVGGGAVAVIVWSGGAETVCMGTESGPTTCNTQFRPWQGWAYLGAGTLVGAGIMGAAGLGWLSSRSD